MAEPMHAGRAALDLRPQRQSFTAVMSALAPMPSV
jgi:hypothetical protein